MPLRSIFEQHRRLCVIISFLIAIAGLLAAVGIGLAPVAKRMMGKVIIPISVQPAATGIHAVTSTSVLIPVTRAEGQSTEDIPVELWSPPLSITTPPGRFPIILYISGWDGNRTDNTFAARSLASHGYVVAAIDDIGADIARERTRVEPNNRTAFQDLDFSSEAGVAKFRDAAKIRLHLMVRKTLAVLNGLAANRTKPNSPILATVQFDRVGIFGFSFGGTVAAEVTRHDKRFVAVANMDGWLFGEAAIHGIETPYLSFNSDFPNIQQVAKTGRFAKKMAARWTIADRGLQERQLQRPDAYILYFRNVEHSDFTDTLFAPSLKSYIKFWRRTNKQRLELKITFDTYLEAFFGHYLRHDKFKYIPLEKLPKGVNARLLKSNPSPAK